MYYLRESGPDVIAATMGAFADQSFPRPRVILANSGMILHDYMDD